MMYRNSWIPEVFNGLFNEGNMQKANTTAPAINVKESLTKYTVELAAPGMRKDDFEVNLNENGDLHIKMRTSISLSRRSTFIYVASSHTLSLSRP